LKKKPRSPALVQLIHRLFWDIDWEQGPVPRPTDNPEQRQRKKEDTVRAPNRRKNYGR
jgi:hypothetical protein